MSAKYRTTNMEQESEKAPLINCSDDAVRVVRPLVTSPPQEHVIVIGLNSRNRLLYVQLVSLGTSTHTATHPRDVFRRAIVESALRIIIAHNHPSGDVSPSEEDIAFTRQIEKCGELLGIPVVDSIVFSANAHRSIL